MTDYTITVKVMEGSGSISIYKNNSLIGTTISSDDYTFNDTDVGKFVANPDTGYLFQKWCDQSNICVTGNPLIIGFVRNREIRAYFINISTALQLEVKRSQGEGKVNVYRNNGFIGFLNELETSEIFYFANNDSFKLEAYPSTGYIFVQWCDQSILCTHNPDLTGTITSNQTGSNAKRVYFTSSYNKCVSNVCRPVAGSGTNECSVIGNTCGISDEHKLQCSIIDIGCLLEKAFGIPSWVIYVIIGLIIIFIIMYMVK